MDLMMPVMTGFEFRQEQMRHPEFGGIPISSTPVAPTCAGTAAQLEAVLYVEQPIRPGSADGSGATALLEVVA
jgi:CheY-like chemotaxis protein